MVKYLSLHNSWFALRYLLTEMARPQCEPEWMDGALIGFCFLSVCHIRLTFFVCPFSALSQPWSQFFLATLFSPCPLPSFFSLISVFILGNFIFSPPPTQFLFFFFFAFETFPTHYYLKNVLCKKRWHSATSSNNVLCVVTDDNNIFELQNLFEHNDFANKPTKTFDHVMLIYAIDKI